jgi:pentatricopeptide repeat protein
MRPIFPVIASSRPCTSLRRCITARNQLFSISALRHDSFHPTHQTLIAEPSDASDPGRTLRIAHLLTAEQTRRPPSQTTKSTPPLNRSRRVATFTPKGFERHAYTQLANYIALRTPQNEADLLNCWKDFLWQWGSAEQRPQFEGIAGLDWSFLPQINGRTFYNTTLDGRSTAYGSWRIRLALPLLTGSAPNIFDCLLGTFCALLMERNSLEFYRSHGSFLYFAACMIYRVSLTASRIALLDTLGHFELPPDQQGRFSLALDHAQAHSTIVLACSKLDASELSEMELDGARVDALEEHYIAKLERLAVGGQPLKLRTIWQDAHHTFDVYNTEWTGTDLAASRSEPTKLTPNLYLSFMRVGYLLGRQLLATEAWNEMTKLGVKPDIKHITTAIKGAGTLKEPAHIASLWQMVVQSGIRTDDQVWSARIGATIQSGNFTKGLAILEEMGDAWSQSVKTTRKPDGTVIHANVHSPKPTTSTLNVAISALANANVLDFNCIQNLIKWAASIGIQSDTVTCNAVISMFVRSGRIGSAFGILGQMESQHIPPDVVTCTMLISRLLTGQDISSLTQEERTDAVIRIIELMERHSIVPNDRTLAALLKGALSGSIDHRLSSAIIAFARSNGQKFYGRLATELLEYILQSPSHDVQPILSLWNHVNNANMQTDAYFFNRMVEGFAKAGELRLMVIFLTRMIKNGMSPTWHTLLSALSVSTEVGTRNIATRIVAATYHASKATTPDDSRKERLFWDLAESYGFTKFRKVKSQP